MSTGIIVFAHGSRMESANQAVRAATDEFAQGFSLPVEAAFLEFGEPDLAGAAGRLYARGVRKIAVLPYFLTLGVHLERDLPAMTGDLAVRYPDLSVEVAPPLDGHPALVEILRERAQMALSRLAG